MGEGIIRFSSQLKRDGLEMSRGSAVAMEEVGWLLEKDSSDTKVLVHCTVSRSAKWDHTNTSILYL